MTQVQTSSSTLSMRGTPTSSKKFRWAERAGQGAGKEANAAAVGMRLRRMRRRTGVGRSNVPSGQRSSASSTSNITLLCLMNCHNRTYRSTCWRASGEGVSTASLSCTPTAACELAVGLSVSECMWEQDTASAALLKSAQLPQKNFEYQMRNAHFMRHIRPCSITMMRIGQIPLSCGQSLHGCTSCVHAVCKQYSHTRAIEYVESKLMHEHTAHMYGKRQSKGSPRVRSFQCLPSTSQAAHSRQLTEESARQGTRVSTVKHMQIGPDLETMPAFGNHERG
jgi:hypothetical protein